MWEGGSSHDASRGEGGRCRRGLGRAGSAVSRSSLSHLQMLSPAVQLVKTGLDHGTVDGSVGGARTGGPQRGAGGRPSARVLQRGDDGSRWVGGGGGVEAARLPTEGEGRRRCALRGGGVGGRQGARKEAAERPPERTPGDIFGPPPPLSPVTSAGSVGRNYVAFHRPQRGWKTGPAGLVERRRRQGVQAHGDGLHGRRRLARRKN